MNEGFAMDETPRSPTPARHTISYRRLTIVLLPAAAVLVLAAVALSRTEDPSLTSKNRRIDELVLATFGVKTPTQNRLDQRFSDVDDDLVADPPTDPDAWLEPDPIHFTYIAGVEPERDAETWSALVDHLARQSGREVVYVPFATIDEQLAALSAGELHVCGLNTGSVPLAVNAYGFVPVCTYGAADGTYGYRMQIVVPADSRIKSIGELRREDLFAFTHPTSNSGFKAPLVLLMNEFGLQPERDYRWAFAGGHDAALAGIIDGVYDAAAVAGDLLRSATAAGDVEEGQLQVIYESERFPPAAIGYVYNLQPELADKLRAALLDYSFEGTPLAEHLGPAGGERFVGVTYKDDWALIRRNDDTLGIVHTPRSK